MGVQSTLIRNGFQNKFFFLKIKYIYSFNKQLKYYFLHKNCLNVNKNGNNNSTFSLKYVSFAQFEEGPGSHVPNGKSGPEYNDQP